MPGQRPFEERSGINDEPTGASHRENRGGNNRPGVYELA